MRSLLSKQHKKGQVGGLAPAIISLVFAGIVLVMGIIMSQGITDTRDGTEIGTISVNETLTLTATSIVTPAHAHQTDCGYESWTPTAVYNDTDLGNQTLAVTTDYTINAANGTISNVTYWETPLKVTYTYTWGGEACEVGNLTVVGLGTFADFWEIIVLAIVITVVIGLLLVIFGGQQRR